jgi:thiol-disulfide isomerase/thioredoxin
MSEADRCELIGGSEELEKAILSRDRLFVLFYALWCPFSMAFLPEYLDLAEPGDPCYVRILSNDQDAHVEKYGIEVYPTVLYFEKGRLARRLDGRHLVGLNRKKFESFVGQCRSAK